MRYWIDLRGVMNQTKLVSGRFGFSRGSGSSRPRPAGDFSVSSNVIKWISASTLPLNDILTSMRRISFSDVRVSLEGHIIKVRSRISQLVTVTHHGKKSLTVTSFSAGLASSVLKNGHHPLILLSWNIETVGMFPLSRVQVSTVQLFAVFAPRGIAFRSSVISP